MSHVTAGWVLAKVDALTPNPYTEAEKRHWLLQAECFAAQTIGFPPPEGPLEDGQMLLAPVPYDGLYLRYIEAQIHYAGGEMTFHAGSTDCNIPLSMGIPAICVGCYKGRGAHTREEYVEIDSLLSGLKIAFELLLHHFE